MLYQSLRCVVKAQVMKQTSQRTQLVIFGPNIMCRTYHLIHSYIVGNRNNRKAREARHAMWIEGAHTLRMNRDGLWSFK